VTRLIDRPMGMRLALFAGAATAVLGIVGLAGIVSKSLMEIAAITGGLALLGYGGEMAGRVAALAGRLSEEEAKRLSEAGIENGGYSAVQSAGAAGVILGILALLGVASDSLPSITAIVLGGALVYSVGSTNRLLALAIEEVGLSPMARMVAREHVTSASGGYVLAGMASGTLGILAIVITGSATVLTLVAFLALGLALLGGAMLMSVSS